MIFDPTKYLLMIWRFFPYNMNIQVWVVILDPPLPTLDKFETLLKKLQFFASPYLP